MSEHPAPPPPPVDLTPRFCNGCGAALIRYQKQYGFDSRTGEPDIHERARCPNRRWWHEVFGPHHDR